MLSSEMPSRIPIKKPFAQDGDRSTIANVDGNDMNYITGFPSVYSAPGSQGGKYLMRAELNALGNVATNDLFYHKCGGLNTFDPAFAAAIGGYPKGAILQYLKDGNLYFVMSMYDHNTRNFNEYGIDGTYWKYCYASEAGTNQDPIFAEITSQVNLLNTTELLLKKTSVSGILSVYDVSYTSSSRFTTYDNNNTPSTDSLFGCGIMIRTGSDPTAFALPTVSSSNDYHSVYNFAGTVGGGNFSRVEGKVDTPTGSDYITTFVTTISGISTTWSSSPSPIMVNAGDYISVIFFGGCTNEAVEWRVTRDRLGNYTEREISSTSRYFLSISGLSFKVKII
jgi:hypothetical protein